MTVLEDAATVDKTPPEVIERADDTPPAESAPPDPAEEVARLREENARLSGENRALRETRHEPAREPAREEPRPDVPANPHAVELANIRDAYRKGEIDEAEFHFRCGALGADATLSQRDARAAESAAKTRAEEARQRAGQKIAAYLRKIPGLRDPAGADMQRVQPHLRAVCEDLDLPDTDERAQALALERAFGPIDRSPSMAQHREFERTRYPIGGGGGGGGSDEPAPKPKVKSRGEDIFNRLLPEYQDFYVKSRGSKEAAIKTLDFADERLMRKQGRFAA